MKKEFKESRIQGVTELQIRGVWIPACGSWSRRLPCDEQWIRRRCLFRTPSVLAS